MKKNYAFLLGFSLFLSTCISPNNNQRVTKALVLNGYVRDSITMEFNFTPRRNDTIEENYFDNFIASKSKVSFLNVPTIKDSIHITMGFEQLKTVYCKDTIDIYFNNKLLYSKEHPSNPQCTMYYPELSEFVEYTYINHKRRKKIAILIAFHNEKIYFDTIISLRFKHIYIPHAGNGFSFRFEKAL